MRCPQCQTAVPSTASYCPSCGESAPAGRAQPTAETRVLAPGDTGGASIGERLGGRFGDEADRMRDEVSRAADGFRRLPPEVRLAAIGTAVALVGMVLPYAAAWDHGYELGRVWWRPLTAAAALGLLSYATTRRRHGGADALLVALVIAAVGVTEAGLVALLSGDVTAPRIGFFVILAGTALVLTGALIAAHRRLAGNVPVVTSVTDTRERVTSRPRA